VSRAIWGRGGRRGGGTGERFQDIQAKHIWYRCDLTKYASKDGHDVKVAAADTPRTLTGTCTAGVGVTIEDAHSHSQRR